MKIAVIQTNPQFGAAAKNTADALAQMGEVPVADLFVLPELFNTGYNFSNRQEAAALAEPADGETAQALIRFAKKQSCYVAFGFAEKADAVYNSALLVGPQGVIGVYRKVHLYYRENLFFTPGNLGFPVFDLPFGKIGMMICFDWIYPESARTLALNGAQIIAHPSNLVLPYCPDAMVTRCLENRVFAATANRVGREDRGGIDLSYIGTSEIVSPQGKILARLTADAPGVASAVIDPAVSSDKRINEFNDLLSGRRVDQYQPRR
jgi:predicted amidohydrolase